KTLSKRLDCHVRCSPLDGSRISWRTLNRGPEFRRLFLILIWRAAKYKTATERRPATRGTLNAVSCRRRDRSLGIALPPFAVRTGSDPSFSSHFELQFSPQP